MNGLVGVGKQVVGGSSHWSIEGLCPFLSVSLLPGCHEVSSFLYYTLSSKCLCFAAGLKAMELADHGLKPETVTQNKSFLL
jgi:hypothetical protein